MSSQFQLYSNNQELYEMFPNSCFPEVRGMKLKVTQSRISICGSDSLWQIQTELPLASGLGCMHFDYNGSLRMQSDVTKGAQTTQATQAFADVQTIFFIKRDTPYWEFLFSTAKGVRIKLYADITAVSWKEE